MKSLSIGFALLAWFLLLTSKLWSADVVRVGYPSLATGFAASWVTADKGFWKKHGLDVELIFLRGGGRTVAALIGGSVDFILGSDLGVTTGIIQGASFTRVGVTTNTLGYSIVVQPEHQDRSRTQGQDHRHHTRARRSLCAGRQAAARQRNGRGERCDVSIGGRRRPGGARGGAVQRCDSRDHVHAAIG